MNNKLEKLTPEQETAIPKWREAWLEIGLATETKDYTKEELLVLFRPVYEAAGLPPPTIIVKLDGPVAGSVGSYLMSKLSKISGGQVRDQVKDQIRDQVKDQIRDQVLNQVLNQVGGQIWNQIKDQVRDQVLNQVGDQVKDQIRDQVLNQVGGQIYKTGYGSHDSSWISFYQFFRQVCNIPTKTNLNPIAELCKHIGWWWPFQNAVIVTPKPKELHMKNNRLHKDLGPAILYRDGTKVYALNGVRFQNEMIKFVIASKGQLSSEEILNIKNVEQRAEIIKKYGIDKLLSSLDTKILHKSDGYELLSVDLKAYAPRIYIKMQNPSVDEIHIEAVHPDCKSVEQALAWRNGLEIFIKPLILT